MVCGVQRAARYASLVASTTMLAAMGALGWRIRPAR
jgi:hypothetical protein